MQDDINNKRLEIKWVIEHIDEARYEHVVLSHYFDKNRSFFEFAAISCIWADSRQSHALCFNFLHLKQSSFLNNFFLAESTFDILSFFHAKIEAEIAVVIIVKMLAVERAT